MTTTVHACKYMTLFLLFIGVCCLVTSTSAQTVSHPVSEITTTAKHYSYTYNLSPTEKKDIEYIIVKASNGDSKTVFNACDVCYLAYKGYSQTGTELRCNNCGNRFQIDALGNNNTSGTCSPGYLPRTIQGNDVMINVSDLITGAYFFRLQTITGVDDVVKTPEILLTRQDRQNLIVTLAGEGHRTFQVFSVNGQHRRTVSHSSKIVRIDIADLTTGAYVLLIEEAKALSAKTFLVY